jgi:hypothetical protein
MQFNVDPYYDDFEQNALDNNYVRVLFKPGRAVQARELTQIQSILQNQIKQFGDHIFQDGSPVIGGNLTLDNKVKFLKLEETYNNEDVDTELFEGRVVRSLDGTVQAKVLTTFFPTDGFPTLLVKYITGNEFTDASIIRIAGTSIEARLVSSNSTGFGTVCSINEGVFYVDGFFVQVGNQTTAVNPYGTDANVKIGLEISDDIVDSEIDTTLLDPAQGSFNYQAPGGDRYQFNLTLTTRPLDAVVDESQFFELMRVENGAITKQVKYPVYAELEKTLARRTFDESGDYVVRPFRATINDGENANNYVISIEPGKAYVKGFEFETLGTFKMETPKPRRPEDIKSLVDVDVDISYGNFIYVTSMRGSSNGFINIAALEKVDIHIGRQGCIFTAGAGNGTANAFVYANTRIGSARVKNFVRQNPDLFNSKLDSNGIYKLYLTDINIEPKVLKVKETSPNAQTIVLTQNFCANVNNFLNVSVTILPVRLDPVPNVNTANIFVNSYRLNANSSVAGVFNGNVTVGSIIRVADQVREVVSVNTAGDFLTVNRAWDKTFVATNSLTNPLSVLVQSPYNQNVTSQTRTIRSAANNVGGANLHFYLDRPFDNLGIPDSNTVIQFNYGIKEARSFCSGPVIANTLALYANSSFDVSSISTLINNETYIEDPQRNVLIFKLPATYVRRTSLNNADYNHFKLIADRANTGTPGEFTIAQGSGFENFETIPWADSTSSIQQNLIFIVRDNNGNTEYPNGSILQLTSANVSLSGAPVNTITIDTEVPDIIKADIIVNVKENDAEDKLRTKVFIQNTTPQVNPFTYPSSNVAANVQVNLTNLGHVASIDVANGYIWLTNPTYNGVRPGDSISLFIPDVLRVRSVVAGNTTHLPDANNATDITGRFLIDYGQKDDRYEHAKLVLRSGFDSPNSTLLVHVDFFQHIFATGANVSFFSADSYPASLYNTASIPIYLSSSGEVYYLRDCLDFRPTLPIGSTSGLFTVPNIPGPDETSELSHDYYLPRVDKLVLSKDKEFRVISGKSAPNPLPPEDLDDAMTLYQIKVPAFGADVREFNLRYVDNRRLTMKELANLQRRVETLEFYTSFNNVELMALGDKTSYEDGTEKEKYGIVGENFSNFNIADYKNPDFKVAIDNGFMVPAMRVSNYGFKNLSNVTTKVNKKTISLEYTEVPAIVQGVTSNKSVSIQPFLFGSFNGTLELTPETDYWINNNLKPEIISVPERIIEKHHVIREIVREPAPPVTIINNYPVTNVIHQIIVSPGEDPPPVPPPAPPGQPPVKVIVDPPPPPIVIPPEPTPPVIVPPPPPPVLPPQDPPPIPPPPPPPPIEEDPPYVGLPEILPIKIELDPCFSVNFGINFTFGTTGFSSGLGGATSSSITGCGFNDFWSRGGLDELWYPPMFENVPIDVFPVIESPNPITTPPIVLTGGGGSGGRGSLDFDTFGNTQLR